MVLIQADEFVLLDRAIVLHRTGELVGGGRPGLATLLLAPFAAACRNAAETIVHARLLWTGIYAGMAVSLWFLLRGALPVGPLNRLGAATGLALWALALPVLYTSTQVRSDQPAILFGLLGGVALLASRRRVAWAAAAGLLLGIGFLFSQKLMYVAGLVGVLAAGQLVVRGEWRVRREALRASLTLGALAVAVIAYRLTIGIVSTPPALVSLGHEMSTFEYYRGSFGWDYYRRMVPGLIPQGIVLIGLVALTLAWIRNRGADGREILVAWGVTGVGLVVLFFHAGRFDYFYMTLGLFPAAIGALIARPVIARLPEPGRQRTALAAIWLPLVFSAATLGVIMAIEPRLPQQRASLDWIERSFDTHASGFNNWAVFACRHGDRFPVRFGKRIHAEFGGADRDRNIEALLAEFRTRSVAFMIPPLEPFPEEIEDFWRTRYVHYHGGVHVAGRRLSGGPGWTGSLEPIVAGDYAWISQDGAGYPVEVEGRVLEPGGIIRLDEQRPYTLSLPEGGDGLLVLSLPEPPARDSAHFFGF